jgi:hypothetical protein
VGWRSSPGVLALAHLPVHSAACGALAWLTAMPCVWMARAPLPAQGYEDEDEGDDGGEPWPRRPGAPPSPKDRRPGACVFGLGGAVAWARSAPAAHLPRHVIARREPAPCAAAAPAAPASAPASCATEQPAVAQPRRLTPRPRGMPAGSSLDRPHTRSRAVHRPAPARGQPSSWTLTPSPSKQTRPAIFIASARGSS